MNGGVVSIRFNSPLNLHSSKLGSGWNEKMFLTNYSGRAYALHTLPFSLWKGIQNRCCSALFAKSLITCHMWNGCQNLLSKSLLWYYFSRQKAEETNHGKSSGVNLNIGELFEICTRAREINPSWLMFFFHSWGMQRGSWHWCIFRQWECGRVH